MATDQFNPDLPAGALWQKGPDAKHYEPRDGDGLPPQGESSDSDIEDQAKARCPRRDKPGKNCSGVHTLLRATKAYQQFKGVTSVNDPTKLLVQGFTWRNGHFLNRLKKDGTRKVGSDDTRYHLMVKPADIPQWLTRSSHPVRGRVVHM